MANVNLSRRALIAAVALPVSGLTIPSVGEPDPIFCAIETWRAADAAIRGTEVGDTECFAHLRSELALWRMAPRSFEGLLAKMRFAGADTWGWSELTDEQQALQFALNRAHEARHETLTNDLARLLGAS